MCGIWSYINLSKQNMSEKEKNELFSKFMKIQNRGPDSTIFENFQNVYIGFHRLAIMDLTYHSNQPYHLFDDDTENTVVFICNGEIYNFKYLNDKYNLMIENNSDCLSIPKLYMKKSISSFFEILKNEVKGEYAFILYEFDKMRNLRNVIYARDNIGIRPLYYASYDNSYISFCSEIKGLTGFKNIKEVKPGSITHISFNSIGTMSDNIMYSTDIIEANHNYSELHLQNLVSLKQSILNSIERRLFSDRPIAFLLSGGVDSSLVAAISAKILRNTNPKINTFCCGMEGGTDLVYARKVAKHIGSNHTEVIFTPEEGLEAIRDVIYTTETWDTTTIRASVGQYMLSKYISQNTEAKVILVGEGPDEVCSSYLFNYYAPSNKELHETAVEYVKDIHLYDCRRVDRCAGRWGLECRVPFLDPEFINEYWKLNPFFRNPNYKGIEKYILRSIFDQDDLLPKEVLYRRKEAFSDGISNKQKSWFEILNNHISTLVSKEEFEKSGEPSIEAYYYKKVFIEFFGEENVNIIPHYWQPKWVDMDGKKPVGYIDPSARVLNVYNN